MHPKYIKQISSILNTSKSTLRILNTMKVENNILTLNNLDTIVEINTDIENTFLCDMYLFSKSLSIVNSKTTDFNLSDFPGIPELLDKIEISSNLLSESLKSYLKYASIDFSRPLLNNVNFKSEYATWCTDGHKAIINKNLISPINFSLHPETVLIHDILLKSGESVNSIHLANRKIEEENNDRFTLNYEYIIIKTNNCKVISKLYKDSPLPDLIRVIPDLSTQYKTQLTFDQIKTLKTAIDILLPYSNKKTHLIKAWANKIYVLNRDTKKHFSITLPFNFTPEFYPNNLTFHTTGFNALYLSNILNDITSDCIIHFKTPISVVYFQCENQIDYSLMPLYILEENNTEDKTIFPYYEDIPLPLSTPVKKKSISKNHQLKKACETLIECSEQWEKKERVDFNQLDECIQLIKTAMK